MWPFTSKKPKREPWEDKFAAFAPLVMVSTQVMGESRLPICFVYRTHPNNKYDSGWVFFSGRESSEFLSDANNAKICPLLSYVEMDSSLVEIVDSPFGSVWERRDNSSPWQQVFDYEIPDFNDPQPSA